MYKLGFCSLKECQKWIFQQSEDLKFQDFPFGAHHESTSWRYLIKQTDRNWIFGKKIAVDKSAWAKALDGQNHSQGCTQ